MTLRAITASACLLTVVACALGPLGAQDTKDAPPPVIQRSEGPYYAGIGRVQNPVLRPDSKVAPVYPKKEDRGFGAASEEAVTRWRYEPATLDGAPVAVFFTVVVDFVLK